MSKKLTLEELAVGLGYNAYTIGRWERGDMPPTLTAVQLWAEELGCKVSLELPFKLSFPTSSQMMVRR